MSCEIEKRLVSRNFASKISPSLTSFGFWYLSSSLLFLPRPNPLLPLRKMMVHPSRIHDLHQCVVSSSCYFLLFQLVLQVSPLPQVCKLQRFLRRQSYVRRKSNTTSAYADGKTNAFISIGITFFTYSGASDVGSFLESSL